MSVGLGNTSSDSASASDSDSASASVTPPLTAYPGTINAIMPVDAALTPSAIVNAVITASEAKTMTLTEREGRMPAMRLTGARRTRWSWPAVACTQREARLSYAGLTRCSRR